MRKLGRNKKNSHLVFGYGQMAKFIEEYLDGVFVSHADITREDQIEEEIVKFNPAVVINTAAITSLEECEQNKTKAFETNTLGAYKVWQVCKKHGIFLCHFSSGCIFSSNTPDEIYSENSIPNPKSYYSWTKVWAENLLGKSPNLLVVRPRQVISSRVDDRNTLAKWAVYSHFISDQNSTSVVEDFMPVLKDMINRRISGTFHLANPGTISPLEVAYLLKEKVNPKMKIYPTTLSEINKNLIAKRVTTVLSVEALRAVGYILPPIRESIVKVIEEFKVNLEQSGGLESLNPLRVMTKEKFSLSGKRVSRYINTN